MEIMRNHRIKSKKQTHKRKQKSFKAKKKKKRKNSVRTIPNIQS